MSAKAFFRRLIPRRAISAREAFKLVVGVCPVCSGDLSGHSYAEVGSVFANDPITRHNAEMAAARRDWGYLKSVRQWDADADVIEYRVIRCAMHPRVGLLKILFTADLWSDDTVLEAVALTPDESKGLIDAIGDAWRPL